MSQKVVILDAGHGGVNPLTGKYVTKGKRSPIWPDGSVYYEGVGNREIVKFAAKFFKELCGQPVKVLYTVDPDNYQDVALSTRVRIANDHYRKHRNAFLVSVHSNGYKLPSAHGTEVFTSPGLTRSDAIATTWMQEIGKYFPGLRKRTDFDDGDIDKEAKFTIINDTACPAILIESMFHTNPEECKMLMNPLNQAKIARAIVRTVLKTNL